MKKLLFAVIVSAAWIHAAAALTTRQGTKRPSFEDFRVTEVFRGRPVPPVLDTPKARAFRTQLRRHIYRFMLSTALSEPKGEANVIYEKILASMRLSPRALDEALSKSEPCPR